MEEDGHDHMLYASYNGGNIKDEINQNGAYYVYLFVLYCGMFCTHSSM